MQQAGGAQSHRNGDAPFSCYSPIQNGPPLALHYGRFFVRQTALRRPCWFANRRQTVFDECSRRLAEGRPRGSFTTAAVRVRTHEQRGGWRTGWTAALRVKPVAPDARAA